jgi:hypothetical protein
VGIKQEERKFLYYHYQWVLDVNMSREREGERERGNLSTHADQYYSSIVVVALLSFFFYMCHWTELNFNDSCRSALSTTNYIDLY